VRKETYHFEVKDLVTQFTAAFDDIIIKRYDKDRVAQNKVQVRYVYAPKQRVLYDLVNKAQNLTVPAVAINITSVSRDESRVFNKLAGFYISKGLSDNDAKNVSQFYRTPIPVNIGISMSIITKFQTDMDQIISNFVPYSNPYIILSWKVPIGLVNPKNATLQEIRSEVLWDGNISLSYPIDLRPDDKYRIIGDTTFQIKGWLFPGSEPSVGNIYKIDSNFNVETNITTYDDLSSSSIVYPLSSGLVNETETVSISGKPSFTNSDYII
jgi:hypothetical protein